MLFFVRMLSFLFIFVALVISITFAKIPTVIFVFFIISIIYYLVFIKYTNIVISKFVTVCMNEFNDNFKKINLYYSRNYASCIYFDDINKEICFLSSKKIVTKIHYDNLAKAEIDPSKVNLMLFFDMEEKRLNVPFYYIKKDYGSLSAKVQSIFDM